MCWDIKQTDKRERLGQDKLQSQSTVKKTVRLGARYQETNKYPYNYFKQDKTSMDGQEGESGESRPGSKRN